MRSIRLLILAIIVALGATAYAATVVSSTMKVSGAPRIYVTSSCPDGSTVEVTADTTGSGGSKKATIHKFTIAGAETDILVRVQSTGHGLYVDLVANATISSLSASVTSMSLTTSGHPTPAKDATDTAALVAAGGS